MDSGNIAWVMISTALVLFMTPGLAFFYGGMVRSKNFLAMLMQNYFAMGLLAVLWVLFGASIAFGNLGDGGWFGGFDFAGFQDITINSKQFAAFTGGIPDPLFLAFQMTFAIITPALITGATADRLKFAGYAVLIGVWLLVVYSPVAHWAFGGGWIAKMGAFDFAGGLVVHINAGAAALAVILVVGARKGHGKEHMPCRTRCRGPSSAPGSCGSAGSAQRRLGARRQRHRRPGPAQHDHRPAAAMLGWLLVEKIRAST